LITGYKEGDNQKLTITEAAVARTVIGVAAERAAKKHHISAHVNFTISVQTTDNRSLCYTYS
jgi:hypothetical protein